MDRPQRVRPRHHAAGAFCLPGRRPAVPPEPGARGDVPGISAPLADPVAAGAGGARATGFQHRTACRGGAAAAHLGGGGQDRIQQPGRSACLGHQQRGGGPAAHRTESRRRTRRGRGIHRPHRRRAAHRTGRCTAAVLRNAAARPGSGRRCAGPVQCRRWHVVDCRAGRARFRQDRLAAQRRTRCTAQHRLRTRASRRCIGRCRSLPRLERQHHRATTGVAGLYRAAAGRRRPAAMGRAAHGGRQHARLVAGRHAAAGASQEPPRHRPAQR